MTEVLRYAAFTDAGRGGNPAGVVLDAGHLDDAGMLAIAAEVGYSETAFVIGATGPDHLTVRYFSPRAEVAFCGHATIAAAVALAERSAPGDVVLDTRAGLVAVRTANEAGGMVATLTSVPTRTRPAPDDVLDAALHALWWDRGDLDPQYPPHVAYAGNDHLLVPIRSRATLAALDYDLAALGAVMADAGWTTVHAFWAQTPTTFHARDPFPPGGVVEDPATGAAAAAFGGYLRDLSLVDVPGRVTVLQGADMGRPSRLLVDLDAGSTTVRVTGAAGPILGA
ncbi:PhzF family phenazine biosynthesis protein [uncultured Cellulomonas sp.]|uniref:PhzF family phenazine biosynthesis protein n=1 Tax=uncultured Cellulomonas sp. TaxID=189682 RepID=UPI00261AA5D1|nr:PhzF family phenazine biosynthesis isomerase [uncultured Cellulomonas sp.]